MLKFITYRAHLCCSKILLPSRLPTHDTPRMHTRADGCRLSTYYRRQYNQRGEKGAGFLVLRCRSATLQFARAYVEESEMRQAHDDGHECDDCISRGKLGITLLLDQD